jgi:hypothetical protein
VIAGALLAALPFAIGIFRIAGRMGMTLARLAWPEVTATTLDLAAAPRRALVVTLQVAMVLLVALPLFAVDRGGTCSAGGQGSGHGFGTRSDQGVAARSGRANPIEVGQ